MKIKTIFYDFDGVMTNNKVLVSQDGSESVFVNRSDGLAISYFKKLGINQLIISTETNAVVTQRANKLDIDVYQGVENKLETVKSLMKKLNLKNQDVAYVGNDLNDLEVMSFLQHSFCPIDSHPKILCTSKEIIDCKGGNGVIMALYNCLFGEK